MGSKINPIGFRLGVNRDWEAKWYAARGYKETLNEDLRIRKFLDEKLKDASVSTVEIERARINPAVLPAVYWSLSVRRCGSKTYIKITPAVLRKGLQIRQGF